MQIDQAKLEKFMGQALGELGAGMNAALVIIGDKLGLYKAMAGAGPMTSAELAQKTGTTERYVREWLNAQAAGGFVTYDAGTGRFTLPDEQAFALAVEDSPAYLPGAYQVIASVLKDEPRITEAFRTGAGVGWHEHCADLFQGTERFFRPSYAANLVSSWIPALDGVEAKLQGGRQSRGRGLWARSVNDLDGQGLSEVAVRGLRLSRPVHRVMPGRPRKRRGCRIGWDSRWRGPRSSRERVMTWWHFSIACTTWAIPPGRPATCGSRWRRMEHG